MLNIFKKKNNDKENFEEIGAPFNGEVITLDKVPDPVFAEKMMGDGVAIIPSDNKLYSPVEGEVLKIFDSKHAVIFKSNLGSNILVHVGLETVGLEGKPFNLKVKEGDKVTKKDIIMEVDFDYIKANNLVTITPIVVIEDEGGEKREIKNKAYGTYKKNGEIIISL